MNALWLALALAADPGTIERDGPRPYAPSTDAASLVSARAANGIERKLPAFQIQPSHHLAQDIQEAVFLTNAKPLKVRMRMNRGNEPLLTPWFAQVRKLFDYFDRDGSGQLNEHELEFVLSARNMQVLLANSYALRTANDPVLMKDVDRDRDGRVSFDEYAAYLLGTTNALIRVMPGGNRDPYGATLTREMFALLDQNGDGKLSRGEVSRIELFLQRDEDEDECLTALELIPNLYQRPLNQMVVMRPGQPQAVAFGPLTIVPAGQIPTTMMPQIVSQYDRNKDEKLSRDEIAFDAESFDRLDIDRDGQLSAAELEGWRRQRADVEVELIIADHMAQCAVKLTHMSPHANAKLDVGENGRAILRVGPRQHLEFISAISPVDAPNNNLNRFGLGQQFRLVDKQNRGYIEEKDVAAGPQFQFVRILFDAADRDGNGKLTREEYEAYFAVQLRFNTLALGLSHATETPSLFQALDVDRDTRLSVRELRKAWDRLVELQGNGADEISNDILQAQGTIRYGLGTSNLYGGVQMNYVGGNQPITASMAGPIWFRKMDRNGDGDVSRLEFLGSEAEFRRIDTNQDNLIDRSEAEAITPTVKDAKTP